MGAVPDYRQPRPRARDAARAQRNSGSIPIGGPPEPGFGALLSEPRPSRSSSPTQGGLRPPRPPRRRSGWFDRAPLPLIAGALAVLVVLAGVVVGLGHLRSAGSDPVATLVGGASAVPVTAGPGASLAAAAGTAGPTPALTPTPSASASDDAAAAGPAVSRKGRAGQVKLGVFLGTSKGEARSFGGWLGRRPDYVVDFSTRGTWPEIYNPSYMLKEWQGSDYRTVYSVALLPANQAATIKDGAHGDYDKYYKMLAQNLVAHGQGDSILRLGWEFNLGSSHYSTPNPGDFIAYWRSIVTAMRSVPGQKLQFDWNVNVGDTTYDGTLYYPGSQYVDYIGVDVYDVSWTPSTYPYPAGCSAACRRGRQETVWERLSDGTGGLSYWSSFARAKGKPMTLPEWGMWTRPDGHGGGDDPYFITQMYNFIDDPSNHVAYQSYLEADSSDGKHRLTTLTEAGKTYRRLFGG